MKLKLYTLSTPLICLMLISCGGGGGGGALVSPTPVVTTPTYTYERLATTIENGGSVNKVIGRILSQRYVSSEGSYYYAFASTTSATVNFTTPDTFGNQSVRLTFTKDWPSDFNIPDVSYDFSIDSDDYIVIFREGELAYTRDYSSANAVITTVAFWDDEDNEILENTDYVTQSIHFTDIYNTNNFDQLAFVFGDPTKSGNMPSTGSASYNVVSQMWMRGSPTTEGNWTTTEYYALGNGLFSANFSSRTITGEIDYPYITAAYDPTSRYIGSFVNDIIFNGTISGVDFSGDVIWGNEASGVEGFFNGGFFGPSGLEIGGVFNMRKEADEGDNSGFWQATGAFTGCTTC